MNLFSAMAVSLLVIAGLLSASMVHADAAAIQVYKGELRVLVPDLQSRDSLLIRYRSKTREVVRTGINGLTITNAATKEVISLPDRSASLSNRYDQEGYWNTDIYYNGLGFGDDNYQVQGRLTLYLAGSQRTGNFNVYLKTEASKKPPNSTIDWDLGN